MDGLIGAAIGILSLGLVSLAGMAAGQAFEARSTLSAVASMAAADVGVDGGYTAAVQSAVEAALAARGLTAPASVSVNPSGPVYYGATYTFELDYRLPVTIGGATATVPVAVAEPGVSTYPCSSAQETAGGCPAPAVIPAGSLP